MRFIGGDFNARIGKNVCENRKKKGGARGESLIDYALMKQKAWRFAVKERTKSDHLSIEVQIRDG